MNKKILASLVTLLFIALVPALVSAFTVTLVSPASNSVISGSSVVLNATVTSGSNVKNCTFYAKSASTANSSWTELATVTNDTADDTVFNTTFDSTVLEDSNDYQFYVTCMNDTTSANSSTNTGITVDNTVPDTPTSLSPSDKTVDSDGTVTFSATVTDSKTTGCTLHLGVNSYAMTYSGSSCTYTISNLPEREYRWYITASDGTNSTNSATYTLIVDIQKAAGKKYLLEQYLKEKQKKPFTFTIGGGEKSLTEVITENKDKVFWGIIIVLIVIAVIYFGKSGSQRRIVYYRG